MTTFTALWRNRPYSYTMRKEGFAMRHTLSMIVIAGLLIATAVEVIDGWTKMETTRNHYAAPVTGISVALPSGMKSFPVELPQ